MLKFEFMTKKQTIMTMEKASTLTVAAIQPEVKSNLRRWLEKVAKHHCEALCRSAVGYFAKLVPWWQF
jgi:TusA-related sulfurtransferase